MQIIDKNIDELMPYEKNPRKNDAAVDKVAESIQEFGFKVSIVVDKDNVIAAGHTRYKAAKKLGLETVPCIIADDFEFNPPEEPKAKYGDIYQLGRHRLMCGDATKIEDVEKLMNGLKTDLLITDPPYNVDYEGKTKDLLKI